MAQGTQQASWDRPKFTIDCVLANVSRQLEADGCVLERLESGHTCGYKLITPDHLTAGDFVKVQTAGVLLNEMEKKNARIQTLEEAVRGPLMPKIDWVNNPGE